MNRRKFMKSVGVAVVGLGLVGNVKVSAQKQHKEALAAWVNQTIEVPSDEVFFSTNRMYTTTVSMKKSDYLGLVGHSGVLNDRIMSICTSKEKNEGFAAAEGFLKFQPLKAVGVRLGETETDGCIAILSLAFRETEVRTWKDGWAYHQLKGWNCLCIPEENKAIDAEIYKKVNLGDIIKEDWIWTEIKGEL